MLLSIQSSSQLELKPLLSTLEYVFLRPKDTLSVIIAASLTPDQESKLIDVLKQHKGAMRWLVADLKGISHSICMHHIYCENNTKHLGKCRGD